MQMRGLTVFLAPAAEHGKGGGVPGDAPLWRHPGRHHRVVQAGGCAPIMHAGYVVAKGFHDTAAAPSLAAPPRGPSWRMRSCSFSTLHLRHLCGGTIIGSSVRWRVQCVCCDVPDASACLYMPCDEVALLRSRTQLSDELPCAWPGRSQCTPCHPRHICNGTY